jgi:hypothetical protein
MKNKLLTTIICTTMFITSGCTLEGSLKKTDSSLNIEKKNSIQDTSNPLESRRITSLIENTQSYFISFEDGTYLSSLYDEKDKRIEQNIGQTALIQLFQFFAESEYLNSPKEIEYPEVIKKLKANEYKSLSSVITGIELDEHVIIKNLEVTNLYLSIDKGEKIFLYLETDGRLYICTIDERDSYEHSWKDTEIKKRGEKNEEKTIINITHHCNVTLRNPVNRICRVHLFTSL